MKSLFGAVIALWVCNVHLGEQQMYLYSQGVGFSPWGVLSLTAVEQDWTHMEGERTGLIKLGRSMLSLSVSSFIL